ncbi:uncharacterized protein LOC133825218 [Humulus lupulus]|uniref:uncharacterized protein LOC133825218 n=1 Tax=Humulus lupulus TaxID=3486 RepID=UPI002B406DD4|nr:uncharacterized protein LOC133825218 [Humulus lupulus]
MATPNVFDLYNVEEEEEVPQLRRKSSRRQTGETSQRPAKKGRTEDPPRDVPAGQTTIHPPTPAEKETPPAPKIPPPAPKNPPPAAPSKEQDRREETLGAKLSSRAVRVAKDRIAYIGKNDRVKDAMTVIEQKVVELSNLVQRSSSVQEYVRKFDQLSRFTLNLLNTEANRVRKFMKGFKREIAQFVDTEKTSLDTYDEVIEKAICQESWLVQEKKEPYKAEEQAYISNDRGRYSNNQRGPSGRLASRGNRSIGNANTQGSSRFSNGGNNK